MPRRDTKLESEGAEFLVLGNLLLQGISAFKAYTNIKGHDLVATSYTSNRCARIQVKSRWASNAKGFFIRNFDADFVIAAFLNRGTDRDPDTVTDPAYYVFPMPIVKKYLRNEKLPKLVLRDVKRLDIYLNSWERIAKFLLK